MLNGHDWPLALDLALDLRLALDLALDRRRQTVLRQVCLEVGGKRFVTSPLTLRALGPSYFDLLLDDNELAASPGGEDELLPSLEQRKFKHLWLFASGLQAGLPMTSLKGCGPAQVLPKEEALRSLHVWT